MRILVTLFFVILPYFLTCWFTLSWYDILDPANEGARVTMTIFGLFLGGMCYTYPGWYKDR